MTTRWRSLQEKILALPYRTPVYPTHGAGSFCSAPATECRWTTVGDQPEPSHAGAGR